MEGSSRGGFKSFKSCGQYDEARPRIDSSNELRTVWKIENIQDKRLLTSMNKKKFRESSPESLANNLGSSSLDL